MSAGTVPAFTINHIIRFADNSQANQDNALVVLFSQQTLLIQRLFEEQLELLRGFKEQLMAKLEDILTQENTLDLDVGKLGTALGTLQTEWADMAKYIQENKSSSGGLSAADTQTVFTRLSATSTALGPIVEAFTQLAQNAAQPPEQKPDSGSPADPGAREDDSGKQPASTDNTASAGASSDSSGTQVPSGAGDANSGGSPAADPTQQSELAGAAT